MRLEGQTALVTGGGSGAGQAIVAALAAEGAHVTAMGRDAAKLGAACAACGAEAAAGDVTDRERVAQIVDGIVERHGRIDLLVNNAGINVVDRSLERLSPQDWDRVLQINATGAFNTIHAVLPHMRRQRGGLILAVSSMAGHGKAARRRQPSTT